MKEIIMGSTFPLVFETQQSLNDFMHKNGFTGKQTKEGIQYLVREIEINKEDEKK